MVIFVSTSFHANGLKLRPRLGRIRRSRILEQKDSNHGFETFFYNQTIDHFSYGPESYQTFPQRYVINSKFWGGGNSPILAFLGAEAPIDDNIQPSGFTYENAHQFKALIVILEHRYYGKSVPFGSRKAALKNARHRGYFNSAQALADYASILLHIKDKYNATHAPVIAIGASYGGELATWFRLKYPHVVIGSLASSAPILYYGDITPWTTYHSVVSKDFRDTSEECFQTIKKSWSEIDNIASKPDGLAILSKKFKTCTPLKNTTELKDGLDTVYSEAAQYDSPSNIPVKRICNAIENAPNCGDDILCKIAAGVVEAYLLEYDGNNSRCYINEDRTGDESDEGWEWQDIKLILRRSTSNIIFSNGMRDPFSRGGVLENISDSIIALSTKHGSHCLDLDEAKKSDPDWLVQQRKTEVKIMQGWITQYYDDFKAINK
ncbi:prolylcarboxypeptidase-like protein [Citrus sinensis]|uniref:Prolylcarboxypeptidase-like protein n=1 Tax=Citrus sinensis TaxID=2711 RepID=A0ACB8ITI8_CITSI|nr:prolylcarboxypeptidase-like protein [Citrus sinensis]